MKPSTRITQIFEELSPMLTDMEKNLLSIVKYLDEAHEKDKEFCTSCCKVGEKVSITCSKHSS